MVVPPNVVEEDAVAVPAWEEKTVLSNAVEVNPFASPVTPIFSMLLPDWETTKSPPMMEWMEDTELEILLSV